MKKTFTLTLYDLSLIPHLFFDLWLLQIMTKPKDEGKWSAKFVSDMCEEGLSKGQDSLERKVIATTYAPQIDQRDDDDEQSHRQDDPYEKNQMVQRESCGSATRGYRG